jgi:hypothetical protein
MDLHPVVRNLAAAQRLSHMDIIKKISERTGSDEQALSIGLVAVGLSVSGALLFATFV